jgi:hypothetical protein
LPTGIPLSIINSRPLETFTRLFITLGAGIIHNIKNSQNIYGVNI